MKTEAVVFTAPNVVEVSQVTCRTPGPNDVIVRTTHSWISNGTEGSYLRGERVDGDRAWVAGDPWPFPVVAGYQKIGVVESFGAQVRDLEVGETVFVTIGFIDGMHHEYAGQLLRSVAPRHEVYKLPVSEEDPLKYAGLVLAQVGYNAGSRPPVAKGAVAVVGGDGLVGQWTAQTLANRGARVILLGRRDLRLNLFSDWARRNQHEVRTIKSDRGSSVPDLSAIFGVQPSVGVDTVGSLNLMNSFSEQMHRFGHLVSAGFYGSQDEFALQPARYGEHTIHLISGWTRERMESTLAEVAANRIETLPLITHRFPAERAAEAWAAIESKDESVLGVVLDWEANQSSITT